MHLPRSLTGSFVTLPMIIRYKKSHRAIVAINRTSVAVFIANSITNTSYLFNLLPQRKNKTDRSCHKFSIKGHGWASLTTANSSQLLTRHDSRLTDRPAGFMEGFSFEEAN